ncbi:MAG: biotin--[acetyl-CoA-carboxylase] ligase [Phycisphaerales bacterium]|nr:biotin--[acetyl-CoA-carboxylase] ligase [Phycisphaerales bacterium]
MFRFGAVDSTNDAAKRLIAAGSIGEFGVVVAETQTAGRGTNGRHWISPPGGIYLSVVHRDVGMAVPDTRLFTQSAGIGCVQAIRLITGLNVRLKPVNDLVVSGRKLGGILTETMVENGRVTALFTGVGINACALPASLPDGAMPPTSVQELLTADAFAQFRREALIDALTAHVNDWHRRLIHGGPSAIDPAWRSLIARGDSEGR